MRIARLLEPQLELLHRVRIEIFSTQTGLAVFTTEGGEVHGKIVPYCWVAFHPNFAGS